MEDQVRVLRVIEYVGDRSAVEACVKESIQGEVEIKGRGYVIRAATVGTYPEILTKGEERTKWVSREEEVALRKGKLRL